MSIQAASICQRSGEVLLSRQFVELDSTRVHEIFSVYPRLLQEGAQHTTLEEGGVRYIYEPLDELFVVLVTDASSSNVLQDLKTLRLLAQLVKQITGGTGVVDSKDVVSATYSIIDAFDEVVTLGFSENLSASQVETFLRMESHEEKIQQIIERNKQLEAAEERKKKAKQLEAQRMSSSVGMVSLEANRFSSASSASGMGSPATSGMGSASMVPTTSSTVEPSYGSNFGGSSALKGKGLKLGKKSTAAASGAGLPLLADPEPLPALKPAAAPSNNVSKSSSPAPSITTTSITIAEQLTVELTRDGQVKTNRASGTLNLYAGDREHTQLRIKTTTAGNSSDYKPHPKMDRALFASDRVLGLKNKQEALPPSQVLLVKWTVDNVVVPMSVSCWVSAASDPGFLNVTLEYEISPEFTGTLENISVSATLPTSNAHAADPSSDFEQFDDRIVWLIPRASASDSNISGGSFEFTAEADSEEDFYPLEVAFGTVPEKGPGPVTTFGKIDVDAVLDASNDAPLDYMKSASAQTASYIIR